MKNLTQYIQEGLKPPRLSAKNRELWKGATEAAMLKWVEDNVEIYGKKYVEIVDGKIEIAGDLIEIDNSVEKYPYPFGTVRGTFDSGLGLTTLKNCPKFVEGGFSCAYCKNLKSLEGAPEMVDGSFECSDCSSLKSLKGAPKWVGGDFFCTDCGKQFTEDDVRKVCKVGGFIEC